ncbi:MAG: cyclopropane-fatty-acyl-phospholipid synthase family protein [Alphaproteobacteria bacterium]|nr:cyclopropane-fatty-acyl-phospholipid synthase family protein [Alphaproteobacteria bacterium]
MSAVLRVGATPQAIQAHYDAGDAFFALFLDPTRTYSCALFNGDDDLDAAQLVKIDWHLDHAGVTAGKRLLDIGCGWGALIERAVRSRDAAHATGLTLSAAQAAHVASMGHARLEVRLEDWADHAPVAPYDAITSVGAFEHFAAAGLTRKVRVDAYRRFFAKCAAMLATVGRLTVQTIAYPSDFDRAAYDATDYGAFVRECIFPESDLPTLTEILEAADAMFEPVIIRNDRRHYSRTARIWRNRLRARRDEAVALVGARRVDDLGRYFRTSAGAFDIGTLQLLRVAFQKRRA